MQLDLTWFALNILAIPLISAECKYIFNSTKYLITDSYNCLKANIIKINKCFKLWFRCLQAKAFNKSVNANINKQYKKEAAAKAIAKTDTLGDVNTQKAYRLESKKED